MTTTPSTTHDEYPTRLAETREFIARIQPTVWGTAADVATYRLSQDQTLFGDPRRVTEKKSGLTRSIFDVDRLSAPIAALASDPDVLDRARQLLGSEVYLHQTRVNYLPGFTGTGFYWHSDFVPSVGETPEGNYRQSLKEQEAGTPSQEAIAELTGRYGIEQFTGRAGSALWFDSNIMHGSGNNITPFPRSNVFMVFNSVENTLIEPFAA